MTDVEHLSYEGSTSSASQSSLLDAFIDVREKTEEICSPLALDDFVVSATMETSPIKWHLAHSSWFFEHFLIRSHQKDFTPYNSSYGHMFNSYYKGAGSYLDKSKRSLLSRPILKDIYNYRHYVTQEVIHLGSHLSIEERDLFFRLLEIGIHHEQQHQELILMDVKRNFYENPLRPKYSAHSARSLTEVLPTSWQKIDAKVIHIGVGSDVNHFAYDNEKDEHPCFIEPFYMASHLVTNGDFVEFIEYGGYQNPMFWLSDGWEYKEQKQWDSPLYWEMRGGEWWYMTLSGMVPLDWNAPVVHVSYYEARAFARWKGCRLPTEFEWEAAAKLEHSSGDFLDDNLYQPKASSNDHQLFSQIHGSVWEWTESAYLPYPRYRALEDGLSEYNEKFMCNQMVLRGGSCVTPRSHYRLTYRNYYYPHNRWQFAGIRLAKDVNS